MEAPFDGAKGLDNSEQFVIDAGAAVRPHGVRPESFMRNPDASARIYSLNGALLYSMAAALPGSACVRGNGVYIIREKRGSRWVSRKAHYAR